MKLGAVLLGVIALPAMGTAKERLSSRQRCLPQQTVPARAQPEPPRPRN